MILLTRRIFWQKEEKEAKEVWLFSLRTIIFEKDLFTDFFCSKINQKEEKELKEVFFLHIYFIITIIGFLTKRNLPLEIRKKRTCQTSEKTGSSSSEEWFLCRDLGFNSYWTHSSSCRSEGHHYLRSRSLFVIVCKLFRIRDDYRRWCWYWRKRHLRRRNRKNPWSCCCRRREEGQVGCDQVNLFSRSCDQHYCYPISHTTK